MAKDNSRQFDEDDTPQPYAHCCVVLFVPVETTYYLPFVDEPVTVPEVVQVNMN